MIRVGSRLSVYPRECGGTDCWASLLGQKVGLSPRVRGEPELSSLEPPKKKVYPRECGGTEDVHPNGQGAPGLSPRVRGNQIRLGGQHGLRRSIPASAGEPWGGAGGCCLYEVYPRECGGTLFDGIKNYTKLGLSPRVRGNLPVAEGALLTAGSIPASAGEPTGGIR